METKSRNRLTLGVILILLGVWFLMTQWIPDFAAWWPQAYTWPLFIIAAGVILLIIGLLTGTPSMAIPACIVSGIGSLLYWQDMTGNWASWAYVWTLIPGFGGVGTVLAGLLGERTGQPLRRGFEAILGSMVLFLIFAALFGALESWGAWWPLLLIAAGVILLVRALIPR